MNDYDSYIYAIQRRDLARAMGDTAEAKIWEQHVRYWEQRTQEQNTTPQKS